MYRAHGVARTQLRLFDLYREGRARLRLRQLRRDRLEVEIVYRRDLARHAVMVHRVHPISGYFHLEDRALALASDGFHRRSRMRQLIGELPQRDFDVHKLAQPMRGNLHFSLTRYANCSRNRTSPWKNSWISSMPYFSIAIRSTPMPNAKPLMRLGS